ncbi:MAG: molybdenum cofactor biosynthesis protein MoaE [Magnetococcales bacterium]|nr:molybdenum cofactor biosynthesis protein MoaE [Magnetococcales bacterium]
MIRIQEEDFSVEEEMTRLTRGLQRVGGVVVFVGTVRDLTGEGSRENKEAIVALELEHYPGMTEGELTKIERQARSRFDLEALLVIHRVGRLAIEENIVLVIAAAAHRDQAFDACRYVIDYLKIFAPFWKKEILASGERWVHSCPGCIAAATRWHDFDAVAHRSDGMCRHDHPPRQGATTPLPSRERTVDWSGLKAGILTLSDSRNPASDQSGDALEQRIARFGVSAPLRRIVRDDREEIVHCLRTWADVEGLDVILTTGGTGPGPRDVTPEATRMVTERELPGFSETIRQEGLQQVRSALLTRGIAAFRGTTLVVNLPGSTRGAVHSLNAVADLIPHALKMAKGGGHG